MEVMTSPVTSPKKAVVPDNKPRPRKLVSLQYNYSDSEDEESREDRKARVVSTCTTNLELFQKLSSEGGGQQQFFVRGAVGKTRPEGEGSNVSGGCSGESLEYRLS